MMRVALPTPTTGMRNSLILNCALVMLATARGVAQEREDRTLLSQTQMTWIINEVSGERAMHHVLELVPYQRVRLPADYTKPFRESQVISDFAKQYGFANVAIETYGRANQTAWQ